MLSFTLHRHLQENRDVLQCLGLTQDGDLGLWVRICSGAQ